VSTWVAWVRHGASQREGYQRSRQVQVSRHPTATWAGVATRLPDCVSHLLAAAAGRAKLGRASCAADQGDVHMRACVAGAGWQAQRGRHSFRLGLQGERRLEGGAGGMKVAVSTWVAWVRHGASQREGYQRSRQVQVSRHPTAAWAGVATRLPDCVSHLLAAAAGRAKLGRASCAADQGGVHMRACVAGAGWQTQGGRRSVPGAVCAWVFRGRRPTG
jgi:hypothetical protein